MVDWKQTMDELAQRCGSAKGGVDEVMVLVLETLRDIVFEGEHGRRGCDEWRCNLVGSERGHYIVARNKEHARRFMGQKFPEQEFEIRLWMTWDEDGNVEERR